MQTNKPLSFYKKAMTWIKSLYMFLELLKLPEPLMAYQGLRLPRSPETSNSSSKNWWWFMIECFKDILILTDRVRKYIQKYILIASKLRALAIANHVNKHLQSSCKGLKLTVGMWGCHQTATKQMKTDCKWARKVWAWKTHRADCIPFSGVTEGY